MSLRKFFRKERNFFRKDIFSHHIYIRYQNRTRSISRTTVSSSIFA